MSDPVPQMPAVEQYATLTFQFDSGNGRASLTLQGPKVPGVGVTPAMGVSRDAQGNYHFVLGFGDHVYPPDKVPNEIRRLFGDSKGGASGPPPRQIYLPPKDQLRRSDGSFMTYDDYDRQRKLFHSPVSNLGTVWPLLPPALYQALIDFYSGRSRRPLPSLQDAGDFPMPSGDSSYA